MGVIEIDPLLSELSPEAPAGADVEYDPEYFALEKLAQGTPETTMGEETKPAEEPKWSEVKEAAIKLLGRTRDIRVALILSTALLKEDGVAGFRDGVELVKGMVEKMWDHFYPKLDPDDNNDPTIRINLLKNLNGDGSSADMYKFKQRLKEAILTNSKQRIGAFSYRDIQVVNGEITLPAPKEGQEAPAPPTKELVNAAFEDTATEDLQATQTMLQGAIDDLAALDSTLTEKVGGGNGPDLSELNDTLKQIKGVIDDQLARRGIGDGASPDASADGGGEISGSEGGGGRRGAGISGEINSREDVIRMLDKINEYYERYEPGSPVPIFMTRAKRLVTMNFADLIKDLAPEANDKIALYSGEAPAPTG